MAKKTPPFPGHKMWTTARFWSFIRSGLRSKFNKWPPKWECLNESRRVVTGQRHKYEYRCAMCLKWWKAKEVEVDHITPVGSLKSEKDLPKFVLGLFAPRNKLQVLCRKCHKRKTASERAKG